MQQQGSSSNANMDSTMHARCVHGRALTSLHAWQHLAAEATWNL